MKRLRRAWLAGFAGLCLVAALSAWAHTLSVARLDITVPAEGGGLDIELDLALRDLALALPLDANHDERVTWGELQAVRSDLYAMVAAGLSIDSATGPCSLRSNGLATRRYDDGAYATVMLKARCASPAGLRLHYGLMFEADPSHRALITYRDNGRVDTAIAHAGSRDIALGSAADRGSPFLRFLREGVHHILIGYDHLAFLVSLLLPAALLRVQGQWQPAPGIREPLLHLLGIVTAFTAAHSITLTLAALGWVSPASRWVEATIAASVLLAALNNIKPVVVHRVWIVSLGFGLVHGFGFAGALSELGLPPGARLVSLLGFNLGVELGQLAVVAIVMPVLFLLRRRHWYARWVMPALSLAIAVLAAWWLFVRVQG